MGLYDAFKMAKKTTPWHTVLNALMDQLGIDVAGKAAATHSHGGGGAVAAIGTTGGRPAVADGFIYSNTERESLEILKSDGSLDRDVGSITGEIKMFGGSAAPDGWFICDGAAKSRTTYAALFAVLGTAYGAGDGSTTFNLPDMRGRVPVGVGTGAGGGETGTGLPTGGDALSAVSRGTWKGEEAHLLSSDEMPAHNHGVTDPGHVHSLLTHTGTTVEGPNVQNADANYRTNYTNMAVTGITIQNAGAGNSHNNLQPVMGVNFIIKY